MTIYLQMLVRRKPEVQPPPQPPAERTAARILRSMAPELGALPFAERVEAMRIVADYLTKKAKRVDPFGKKVPS